MESKKKVPLSFEEFQSLLAKELMLPIESLTKDALLIEDLQVDSLAMVSMMLRFEDEGLFIPIERAWDMETVDDIYQAYREQVDGNFNEDGGILSD